MKLLISAYACAPNHGSEHAVGWNWITEAKRQGHEVWALVAPNHRAAIAQACQERPELRDISWSFPEVKLWPLQQGMEPKWERTYNLLWQRAALGEAQKMQARVKFDLVHHLTWAGIRAPTFLGSLKCPLIIGPIGGGETSPKQLRSGLYFRARLLEKIRDISSSTILANPLVRKGLNDAAVIFVSTEDTRGVLGERLRTKIRVFSQVAIPGLPVVRAPRRATGQHPIRLLYAGRLLYWKGIHIALEAIAEVRRQAPAIRLTIVGEGRERERLQAQAASLNLGHNVDFVPRLPQAEFFKFYETHDLLLFPSLHDSGGFVVLEALSHGLPVVCLDLGGPRDIVTPESGAVVVTANLTTQQVSKAVANAILSLNAEPDRLSALSAGAIARAKEFLISERISALYNDALARGAFTTSI